jgi:carbamoyltransferase
MGAAEVRILGINKGCTLSGKQLKFGGAAIYDDGRMVAVGEERVTGRKYAGGYEAALSELLRTGGWDLAKDFDHIAVSSCCESRAASLRGHELEGHEKLIGIQHHFSHAALAFFGSGYDRALVMVADGGGNTLGDSAEPSPQWWHEPREQCSYYLGEKNRLTLIGRDFEQPFEVGFGEIYRAFTYFLGWHSSTHASKTMALAGHARRDGVRSELFDLDHGRLAVPIQNDPDEPLGMVVRLGEILGTDFGEPRLPGSAILRIHRDVAMFVQMGIERAMARRLRGLKREFKVDKLCIAGGVGHNVVANGRMLSVFPGGVYVPSAPGDEGQCLGNIYATMHEMVVKSSTLAMRRSSSACIGPGMKIDSAGVARGLKDAGLASYVVFETTDYCDLIARFLAAGALVCLHQPRSEFGPRALGARSILADPRRSEVTAELNMLKRRDWFMPFAPSVLSSRMDGWFRSVPSPSPFMSFAIMATAKAQKHIPAVVNADGTARVQTVEDDEDTPFARILKQFEKYTKIPVLLNTSFNLGGKPIVETIEQAISSFREIPVNVLGLGRFVVVKSLSPTSADLPLADLPLEGGTLARIDLRIWTAEGIVSVQTATGSVGTIVRRLQECTDSVVFVRTELPLYGQYLDWLREGRKVTTIRFREGVVEIPCRDVLPLYETDDFGPRSRRSPTDYVRISAIRYQRFGDLTEMDAQRDGFESREHMRTALREIYPTLSDKYWVTIYDISLERSGNGKTFGRPVTAVLGSGQLGERDRGLEKISASAGDGS